MQEEIVLKLAEQNPNVRPVIFARNFGHQIAVTAGLDFSRGKAVVIIDADLQDPPEVILELIEKWREGYEVVYAVRTEREGETWFKKTTASLFYRIIFKITDVKIPLDTGDFRLMDRKVVKVMNSMREKHRFLRGMSAWVGFKQVGVSVQASCALCRIHQVSVQEDVQACIECNHGIFLFPAAAGNLFRFYCSGDEHHYHTGRHRRASLGDRNVSGAGFDHRGTIPGRCATDQSGNLWGNILAGFTMKSKVARYISLARRLWMQH